jgi:6-pyruvoyltetrahydropterin/6-carboxytetrahydropterin synthase
MANYHVTVEAVFPATHQLSMYNGTLEPIHGHQWRVQAWFSGAELDEADVLIDFVKVEKLLADVLSGLRDRHLNDLPCFEETNPSAENLARCIFESLRDGLSSPELLRRVMVWEAPNCAAGYGDD